MQICSLWLTTIHALPLGTSLHLEEERTRGNDCLVGGWLELGRKSAKGDNGEKCTGKLGSLSFSNSPTRLWAPAETAISHFSRGMNLPVFFPLCSVCSLLPSFQAIWTPFARVQMLLWKADVFLLYLKYTYRHNEAEPWPGLCRHISAGNLLALWWMCR